MTRNLMLCCAVLFFVSGCAIMSQIPNNVIRRLGYRAGISCLSQGTMPNIRMMGLVFAIKVLSRCPKKTLKAEHVVSAASGICDFDIEEVACVRKLLAPPSGTDKMEYFKNEEDGTLISHKAILSLIKEVAGNLGGTITKITKAGAATFHVVFEKYIVYTLKEIKEEASKAERGVIKPVDAYNVLGYNPGDSIEDICGVAYNQTM